MNKQIITEHSTNLSWGQGRIQPVSLGGAISVTFGGQVSFTG